MTGPTIIVHGGAGNWPSNKHAWALSGVRQAAKNGFAILQNGGGALDAVEEAIIALEDNPIFNAGTGSTMNLAGRIENDASIMDGTRLESGSVALVMVALLSRVICSQSHLRRALFSERMTAKSRQTYVQSSPHLRRCVA